MRERFDRTQELLDLMFLKQLIWLIKLLTALYKARIS